MRLFIAVPLPRDVQKKVFAFEQALREVSTGGRFVPQGNHHIPLRFIGESNDLADRPRGIWRSSTASTRCWR